MWKRLAELKTERAVIKTAVTRFKTYWDQLDKTNPNVGVLRLKLQKLEEQYNAYNIVQTAIDLDPSIIEDAAKKAEEEQQRFGFEEKLFGLIAESADHIASKTRSSTVAYSCSASTSSNSAPSPLTINQGSGYSLPKIPLPTFHGSFDKWIQFRDSYRAIVHDRETIANIDKFHYLSQALKGDAARVIQSLGISDANYHIAWKSLTDRYEDSDALIHHHTKALCEHKVISKESFVELRQFIDDINSNVRALKALGQPTDSWDTLLLYLMSKKLDSNTKRKWEKYQSTLEGRAKMTDFLRLLETHCKFLQRTNVEKQSIFANSQNKSISAPKFKKPDSHLSSHVATEKSACVMCTKPHALYECPEFKKLSVGERLNVVRKFHLCFNCFSSGHGNRHCRAGTCRKCSNKHHTLVHIERTSASEMPHFSGNFLPTENPEQNKQVPRENVNCHASHLVESPQRIDDDDEEPCVILSNAIVHIQDRDGKLHECRALLDSGSQPHLMTEDLRRKLDLPVADIDMTVSGFEQTGLKLTKRTRTVIKSRHSDFKASLRFLVTSRITNYVPINPQDLEGVVLPSDIQLADPVVKNPRIDLLIGTGLFWDILSTEPRKILRPHGPSIQKTALGWILTGNMPPFYHLKGNNANCHLITNQQLHNQVERLWEMEQVVDSSYPRTMDKNNLCEQHFASTTTRAPDERFVVQIPFLDRVNELGESFEAAKRRLLSMERKLIKDPHLKDGYHAFMEEYESLGDMTEVSPENMHPDGVSYYLPHHAVIKPDSTTTKLRVVFDESQQTTSGLSLNDVQHVGPTVQDDLFSIALRFRKHRYVLSADIAKMYRRIYVDEQQRKLQRILWRTDSSQPIKVFELNTVTYGTAAAPFLATRCLRQLGEDSRDQYPTASKAIIQDFYVDDLLTGMDTLEEARTLKKELMSILDPAGLFLRKWASNDERVFMTDDQPTEGRLIQGDKNPKTLGLIWISTSDELRYEVNFPTQSNVTKRTILSLVTQIFDPLGIVGPAIVRARIFLQELWKVKLDWDENLPQEVHDEWTQFRDELDVLNQISVPRLILCNNPVKIELHGFCDASEKAYGASIYVRSVDDQGNVSVNLLCAKSKVAPLKRISLPRLELCGAFLLAELFQKVSTSLDMNFDQAFFWCDSTITLAWIKGPSYKWETYVANRTTKIQELTKEGIWNHISTSDNPADIISRGINPAELLTSDLWWHGPAWLSQDSDNWPIPQTVNLKNVPGMRKNLTSNQVTVTKHDSSIFELFSTFTKLCRVLSWCLRISNNLARPTTNPKTGYLTPIEIEATKNRLIKMVQAESFRTEIQAIEQKREISNSSKLKTLQPFLDDSGLLRVGDRLRYAPISCDQKHQIILPADHTLTRLIIMDEHSRLMHAGCQSVMSSVRNRYWPLSCKNAVKNVLSKCIRCFRVRPV